MIYFKILTPFNKENENYTTILSYIYIEYGAGVKFFFYGECMKILRMFNFVKNLIISFL